MSFVSLSYYVYSKSYKGLQYFLPGTVQKKGYVGFVVKGHYLRSQERRGLGYLTNVENPQMPLAPFCGL
jgi:hypothetical protein